MNTTTQIEKKLSPNDTGENGNHQAGMLIPKGNEFLMFFPKLDASVKNPRWAHDVIDESGTEWVFNFIYYNSRFFGGGKHAKNEYRLTGMTAYLRQYNLKAGDTVILKKGPKDVLHISYRRANEPDPSAGRIKLGQGSWKLVEFSDDD